MKNISDYSINERKTIKEAISVIQSNFSRCVVVLNDFDKVVGVFSEGDVLRSLLNDIDIHVPLKRVINPSFIFLKENDIQNAYELFKKRGITLIPVIDDDFKLKDVITIFDVIEYLVFVNKK